ncbi:hypothetical protein [Paenibacillus sp. 481]|uniref:hypothetical protein n=1 Tax=Paenibacillus sp. 481 TaxID=2835869 RepID=UPI001E3CABD1|nr:hypothetical protein [Paenibacillus sp. 481]UHA73950.1 hypothetical protein KIK04_01940 [Paenibacillus sp. 481]
MNIHRASPYPNRQPIIGWFRREAELSLHSSACILVAKPELLHMPVRRVRELGEALPPLHHLGVQRKNHTL